MGLLRVFRMLGGLCLSGSGLEQSFCSVGFKPKWADGPSFVAKALAPGIAFAFLVRGIPGTVCEFRASGVVWQLRHSVLDRSTLA